MNVNQTLLTEVGLLVHLPIYKSSDSKAMLTLRQLVWERVEGQLSQFGFDLKALEIVKAQFNKKRTIESALANGRVFSLVDSMRNQLGLDTNPTDGEVLLIDGLLMNHLLSQTPLQLNVFINGHCRFYSPSADDLKDKVYDSLVNQPHVRISINSIVQEVIQPQSESNRTNWESLFNEESWLLNLHRQTNKKELKVRYNQEGKIKLASIEKEKKVNRQNRVGDLLKRSTHQSITVNHANGVIQSTKEITTYKPQRW